MTYDLLQLMLLLEKGPCDCRSIRRMSVLSCSELRAKAFGELLTHSVNVGLIRTFDGGYELTPMGQALLSGNITGNDATIEEVAVDDRSAISQQSGRVGNSFRSIIAPQTLIYVHFSPAFKE